MSKTTQTVTIEHMLDTPAAAKYLSDKGFPEAPNTLRKKRSEGGGPSFRLWGRRVFYHPSDLDKYISTRLSEPMTVHKIKSESTN